MLFRKGGQIGALWLIAFRDETSAQAFAKTYKRVLDHTLGPRTPHLVECRDTGVLVIAGLPARIPGLASSIWKSSVISVQPPNEPPAAADEAIPTSVSLPRRPRSLTEDSAGMLNRVKAILRRLAESQSGEISDHDKNDQNDPDLFP